jgi:hypothetical protein
MTPILQRNLMSHEEVSQLFSDLEFILLLNQPLLEQLEEKSRQWPCTTVGDVFAVIAPLMKIYSRYILNYDNLMNLLSNSKKTNPNLVTFLDVSFLLSDSNE